LQYLLRGPYQNGWLEYMLANDTECMAAPCKSSKNVVELMLMGI
jgi:hypothetical protein